MRKCGHQGNYPVQYATSSKQKGTPQGGGGRDIREPRDWSVVERGPRWYFPEFLLTRLTYILTVTVTLPWRRVAGILYPALSTQVHNVSHSYIVQTCLSRSTCVFVVESSRSTGELGYTGLHPHILHLLPFLSFLGEPYQIFHKPASLIKLAKLSCLGLPAVSTRTRDLSAPHTQIPVPSTEGDFVPICEWRTLFCCFYCWSHCVLVEYIWKLP